MNKDKLKLLLRQYLNNTINGTDCDLLLDYLSNNDASEVFDIIDENLLVDEDGEEFNSIRAQSVLTRIKADSRFKQAPEPAERHIRMVYMYFKWAKIAAVITVVATAGLYIKNSYKIAASHKSDKVAVASKILPGGNKAMLTLANGKTILLDAAANGTLAKAGKSQVNKVSSGKLVYNALPSATYSNAVHTDIYNTLATPRGGQYQVVLPDGTQVWLNSSSSLSYPVEFTGNERHVKLTGEAYFEVAKNKDKPFFVDMNKVQVKVLGTHFNIAAYDDDNELTTTLLEGSVQISKNNRQCFIKPGEQAVVKNGADAIAVSQANITQAMAWKNGYFVFNDDNINTIMKKVSRWYNVDIEQAGNVDSQQHFGGTFYRSKGIVELLQNLEKIGKVNFKITGRRVTVME